MFANVFEHPRRPSAQAVALRWGAPVVGGCSVAHRYCSTLSFSFLQGNYQAHLIARILIIPMKSKHRWMQR